MNESQPRFYLSKSYDGVEKFIRCVEPYAEGGVLYGMVEIERDASLRPTFRKISQVIRVPMKTLDLWRVGRMPDGRIAVVEPGLSPRRCAISPQLQTRVYEIRHDSPIQPLPPEVAEALLRKMFRNVDWDSLPWDDIEREPSQENP
jgi:hypothetical protein